MHNEFDAILNECLDLLRQGADVPTCLARYPEHADKLRPLLRLAADIHAVITPAPTGAARLAGRRRMLEALSQRRMQPQPLAAQAAPARARSIPFRNVYPVMRLALAIMIVAIVAASWTVAASASSLPGDALYPVKLTVQQAQIALTLDADARARLEEQIQVQQQQDIQAAQRTRRQAAVKLEGCLEQIEGDTWIVSGLRITLRPETSRTGYPRLGAWVVVRGHLPGDGSLIAMHLIVTDKGLPSPMPTVNPTASPTNPPMPTGTPTPSPAPTYRPEPTETPRPTGTAQPTPTSEPTRQVKPTGTSRPTDEPKPTKEPKPTDEPKPTKAPKPTDEPKPTKEPKPTNEPKPTKEPKPTDEPKPTKIPKP